MLKTRLAEKDAQLMGGFGALSNLQLGSSWGALGGLPDPEALSASLPNGITSHFQHHPSQPRTTAWGVNGGHSTAPASSSWKVSGSQPTAPTFSSHGSAGPGHLAVPLQLPARRQSALPDLATLERSADIFQEEQSGSTARPPSQPGYGSSARQLPRVSSSSRDSQSNQARPALQALVADQLQDSQSALQSPSQAARRLSKEPSSPVKLTSADAALIAQTTLPASAVLQEASAPAASEAQESAPLQPDESPEASGSEPESGDESYTESESEASSASPSRILPAGPSQQAANVDSAKVQPVNVQQKQGSLARSANSVRSSRSAQSSRASAVSVKPGQNTLSGVSLQPVLVPEKSDVPKKKWRMFGKQ